MTQLESLIQECRVEGLTKSQLEDLHSKLTNLFALMHLELAKLEKTEALYLCNHTEKNDVSAKRKFSGTTEGLRINELKHFTKATEKLLSSVKNRIYSQL